MKKRHKNALYNLGLAAILILLVLVFAKVLYHPEKNQEDRAVNPFQHVKKYETLLHDELAKYHLENYTTVLLAVMQQESHGYGGDPMQASESAGLPPNTIKDPKKSIEVGVKHFQRVLAYGEQKKVDFQTILQAYNMGVGYINYVAEHGGKHSEKLAKAFSMIQVHKKPKLYDCGGDKSNFRYPYCYGDFTYSTKVEKTLDDLTPAVPVIGTESTDKTPF